MGKRIQSRHGNGRYRRATLENTFGLTTTICPHCNGINPFGVTDSPPADCVQCGQSLRTQVFMNCNVCGIKISTLEEDEMGMCLRCAAE